MNNLTNIIVSLTVAAGLVACGDNQKAPDAGVKNDAPVKMDAPPIPAAPTLGTVIDRMGRPAVNTALNALIDNDPLKTAKKDAYNHAIDPAAWTLTTLDAAGTDGTLAPKTVRGEFAKQLAILDTLDQGSGLAGTTANPGGGCGNQALHSNTTGYVTLATVLSDDQLYVDTTKLTCNFYLSLEVEVATGGGVAHTQCGGRTLAHDVIDTSYSLLAAGLGGFDAANSFAPRIHDNAPVHTDITDTFPYLGPAH